MKGTAKQIAWAEDIIQGGEITIERLMDQLKELKEKKEAKNQRRVENGKKDRSEENRIWWKKIENGYANAKKELAGLNEKNAGDIINNRGLYSFYEERDILRYSTLAEKIETQFGVVYR